MIGDILLLCIRISLFDMVYNSKSCSMQYVSLHVFFGPLFCGCTHSAIPLLVVRRSTFSVLATAEACFASIRAHGEGWSSIPCPPSSNTTL